MLLTGVATRRLARQGLATSGIAVSMLQLFAAPAPAGASAFGVLDEQVVIQLSSRAEADPAALLGAMPGQVPQLLPGDRWVTNLPLGEAAAVSWQLAGRRGIDYVSAAHQIRAAGAVVPNNPCYSGSCGPTQPVEVENPELGAGATIVHPDGQTDMWAINASQAWGITKGSSSVLVAVLDTGVDPNQAQLKGKVVVGPDVCADDNALCSSTYDNNGHGTFVTGLIAATPNDGTGIAGLGWSTRVLDIKVLADNGFGTTTDEATGIYDAVSAGARVINLSLTSEPCSVAPGNCGPNADEEAAVAYAIAHGVVVVAAAGNAQPGAGPSTEPLYPASYPGVLSVAAATDQGQVNPQGGGAYLDFSEYGNAANIAAPGIDVLSTWYDGNYAVESGTSFAAPHVAAAAALVMAAAPWLSGPQVATLLRRTAIALTPGGTRIDGGFLDVGAAVSAAVRRSRTALDGYELVGRDGSVYSAGVAADEGSLGGHHLSAPIVSAAEAPNGLGYWLAAADGGVFAFGATRFYGSAAGRHLRSPIVAIAPTPDGRGYWLAARNGDVLAFGDAHRYKLHGAASLRGPVVGMAVTPGGTGYWLVTSTGEVYSFGHAGWFGPDRPLRLRQPVVGMAPTADGRGYWLAARDGGVFAFGDATFHGAAVHAKPFQPIVGIAPAPDGQGYWLAGVEGRVLQYGGAPFEHTAPDGPVQAPITAIAS